MNKKIITYLFNEVSQLIIFQEHFAPEIWPPGETEKYLSFGTVWHVYEKKKKKKKFNKKWCIIFISNSFSA